MKKTLCMAALAIISLMSCSKDDSEPATTENTGTTILLKKSIQTINDGEKITATYNYDNNRLLKTEYSDGFVDIYTYSNDKLIKLEVYKNNEVYSIETFSYANNSNVTGYTIVSPIYDKELIFDYVGNDKIKVYGKTENNLEYVGLMQLTGENIFQYFTMVNNVEHSTDTYMLDTKNSPLKNISANIALAIARQKGGANNIRQYVRSGVGTQGKGYSTAYIYNSEDYPTSSVQTDVNGKVIKTEYFYE